jgi:hypothetical protein
VKQHCSLLSLTPITFDTSTFSCYGGSYFVTIAVISLIFRRPLNLAGLSVPTYHATYYYDHCILFRVCSFVELSSSFITTSPEGATIVYTNTAVIFFQSYMTRAWGMPASFVHSFIFYTPHGRLGPSGSFFPPTDRSGRSHYFSLLQQHSQ